MINNEERFFNYFFNKMNRDDLISFENELRSSVTLADEFNSYKQIVELVQETKGLELNTDYKQSVIMNFRERVEKPRRSIYYVKYGIAFASILIFIAGYFLTNQIKNAKPTDELKEIYSQLSYEDKKILADQIDFEIKPDDQLSDSELQKLDSLYADKFDESILESITSNSEDLLNINSNLSDVEDYLTDIEVDRVYTELINKEIL